MSLPSAPEPGALAASGGIERPARAAQILAQCWPVLAEVLLPRVPGVLQGALHAAIRAEDETVVRAAAILQPQSTAVLQAYALALRGAFDAASEPVFAPRAAAPRRAALSLLELEDSDQRSQIEQAAARLRNLLQAPQAALLARLQTLTGNPELSEAQSPLRPAIFLQAMADSLAPLVAGSSAALLRYFVLPLAPALDATYGAVNDYLHIHDVLPYTPLRATAGAGARPPPMRGETAPALALADEHAAAGDAAAPAARSAQRPAAAPPEPAVNDEAALAEYVRLQAALGVNAHILIDAANQALGKAPAATAVPLVVAPAPENLIAFMLSGQRRDAARVAAIREDAGKVEAAGAAAAAPALPDMLGTRDYSRQLIALATSPLHKLTIQLVARLFARIERDRLVPEPLRTLLVCLRFPSLEVALADPALLLRAQHPVRRLLDAIGSSAIGWKPDGPESRRYLHHVRAAVHFVVHSPGSAAQAFAQSVEQFDAFLASIVPPQSEAKTLAKDAVREAERRELQAQEVGRFIEELLRGAVLEDYLRQFLTEVWPRVLVAAAAREGEDPGLFVRLLNLMPDLVASVQPAAPAERKRLVAAIPALVSQLRDGLALIGWPPDKLQALLNRLMLVHAQAADGDDAPVPVLGGFSASTMRIRLDGLRLSEPVPGEHDSPVPVLEEAVHYLLQQRGGGVLHQWIKSPPPLPADAISRAEAAAQVALWRERAWFDLRLGGALVRMRLAWWAPSRSLALFASRSGASLVTFSQASLITYRRCGWIKPAEQALLLARAFRSVLSDLRRAAQAAAGDADGA